MPEPDILASDAVVVLCVVIGLAVGAVLARCLAGAVERLKARNRHTAGVRDRTHTTDRGLERDRQARDAVKRSPSMTAAQSFREGFEAGIADPRSLDDAGLAMLKRSAAMLRSDEAPGVEVAEAPAGDEWGTLADQHAAGITELDSHRFRSRANGEAPVPLSREAVERFTADLEEHDIQDQDAVIRGARRALSDIDEASR